MLKQECKHCREIFRYWKSTKIQSVEAPCQPYGERVKVVTCTGIDKYPHHHGDTYKVLGILTKTRVETSSGTFPRESASKSCCPDR